MGDIKELKQQHAEEEMRIALGSQYLFVSL